eukprot:TRINITY_DN13765_c0_g1_i1.p1 TRINITY_DN13765_c0_g1~~TRINITY_DN13765_c0_g1_i1.p1  ORF type:complete len:192 (-),score=11.55 TRINITY_DN13765_c0_g1_i1:235-810(-)
MLDRLVSDDSETEVYLKRAGWKFQRKSANACFLGGKLMGSDVNTIATELEDVTKNFRGSNTPLYIGLMAFTSLLIFTVNYLMDPFGLKLREPQPNPVIMGPLVVFVVFLIIAIVLAVMTSNHVSNKMRAYLEAINNVELHDKGVEAILMSSKVIKFVIRDPEKNNEIRILLRVQPSLLQIISTTFSSYDSV